MGGMAVTERTTEYTLMPEPTIQVAVRLPQSLVEKIDAERGKLSRAAWITARCQPSVSSSGPMRVSNSN